MTSAICPICGDTFNSTSNKSRQSKVRTYCSAKCLNASRTKHGHTKLNWQSRTYATYQNMIGRCHRPYHTKFYAYGAVGIFVCDRWRESFKNFLEDMGERPDGMTIDRKNGTLGYTPENCRWASPKVQQGNMKSNVNITFMGRTQIVSAWAEELGFGKSIITWRIRSGWTVEKALTTPAIRGNNTKTTGQVLIEFDNKTQCLSKWAREYGISVSLFRRRLKKGWAVEKALNEPKGHFVVKGDHVGTP